MTPIPRGSNQMWRLNDDSPLRNRANLGSSHIRSTGKNAGLVTSTSGGSSAHDLVADAPPLVLAYRVSGTLTKQFLATATKRHGQGNPPTRGHQSGAHRTTVRPTPTIGPEPAIRAPSDTRARLREDPLRSADLRLTSAYRTHAERRQIRAARRAISAHMRACRSRHERQFWDGRMSVSSVVYLRRAQQRIVELQEHRSATRD